MFFYQMWKGCRDNHKAKQKISPKLVVSQMLRPTHLGLTLGDISTGQTYLQEVGAEASLAEALSLR